MTYKVIQWATGGVGRAAIEGVIDHPELELVGCWVHSESKEGLDVGELIGRDPIGVTATREIDALLALGADCVVYSPIVANPREVAAILEAGINIVTPLGWVYPKRIDTEAVEKACVSGNATLHGTGVHPGGITERFPLMVSGLSRAITHVRAEEFSDIRTYGASEVVGEMMLFGKTPEGARTSPMLKLLGGGFFQSIDMVADAIGLELDDEKRATHDMAVATAAIDSPIGVIEPGLVAAQRFCWQGLVRGEPVITAAVNWFMGDENIEPVPGSDPDLSWSFGEKGERFEVSITGDPDTHLTFKGWHPSSIEAGLERNQGIVVTAMHCVSAIPYVCEAGAGIKTYLDLPLIAGRAAPHLLPGA
ncbi:MAG: dihydrodipicolinate reductase [bacterium]|nr:dihydrodipicolinate reductase [Deltaproteobacteria bacterium]MCP4904024.1 dihydrodipicolinate reductase [bacterium]